MGKFEMWGKINKTIEADSEKEAIKIFIERYKNIPIEIAGKKVVIKCEKCNNIISNDEDYGYSSSGDYICESCLKNIKDNN